MPHKDDARDLIGVELNSMDRQSQQSIQHPEKSSSGCHISVAAGFILTFLAIAVAVLIGLIVFFATPGKTIECQCQYPTVPPVNEEQKWQQCQNMASDRDICLGPCDDTTPTSEPTHSSPTPPALKPDVRLPLKVIPLHYDLELTPDIYTGNPDTFSFSGKVRIYLKCEQVTDVITLQINKLEIDGTIQLQGAGPGANAPMVQRWSRDEEKQFLLVHLTGTLTVGQEYMLDIAFNGPLKPDLVGLYWSSYKSGDETRYIATTQMQPTDARKTFPCFDEPAVKATFNTTLLRMPHMKSLSNMNILYSENRPGGWIADVYNRTVKMSTYLLAFVICDFEYTEGTTNTGIIFRVWSRPEAINQTTYALEKGIESIQYFEEYFKIPFPLPKQDMIAVPDFAAGAMENWGLIIYRETALLYDPQLSSASNKLRVAEVVVHELAHQWFGNLVTPVWWDDLWLNEGFASYMEYVGMDKIEPTWDIHDQFVERDLQSVFLIDSLSSSHPIYVPVYHPDEINEIFDRISYLKGSSIIRMMNFFLGESTFTEGLSKYLTEFAYDNANHTDLWRYLGQQAITDNKNIDVRAVMNTWLLQMGYPVVTFDISGNTAQVTQQHFLTDPSKPPSDKYISPYGYKWTIPLTYIQSTNSKTDWKNPTMEWILWTNPSLSLNNLDSNADWLIGNVGQYGYYRVNYNEENWDALINQLLRNYTVIDVRNRAQIIDDSVNLGRSGYLDQLVGLRATEYLVYETHYIPWKAAVDVMVFFARMLRYTEYYGAYKAYMLKQVKPLYESVGYDYDPATESLLEKNKRSLAWNIACAYGEQSCRDQAKASFNQWMANPDMDTLIKPDMKAVIYCNGIRNGGLAEWNFLYQKYKETNVAAEADRILFALSCSDEPWILNRYLHYALDANEIRKQDGIYVMYDVGQGAIGRSLAWDFFRGQWDKIQEIWGSGFFAIANVITGLTRSFNTQFQLDQMLAFKEENHNLGAGTRAFDQAIETVQSNIKWMEANKDKLGEWLISKTNN